MPWAAAAAVAGALITSNSASKASKAQQKSATDANAIGKETSDAQIALQREMFNKTNELNRPALDAGNAARNQLMHYLGLSAPQGQMLTREQIRAELAPQYDMSAVSPGLTGSPRVPVMMPGSMGDTLMSRYSGGMPRQMMEGGSEPNSSSNNGTRVLGTGLNPGGLEAAIEARWAQQQAQQQGQGARPNDSTFGSLMRDFGMSDFERDPGYQFRMDEGQKALERSASARGGLLSGSAAKDTMRFAQNLGSQDYQAAFDRFQVNRANKLNPLQSMSGAGQTAAGTIGNAGQNFANAAGNALGQYSQNAGQNMIGAGNARASGYLAQSNALQNGLNQGVSLWNQYRQQQPPVAQQSSAGGGMASVYPSGGY